MNATGQSTPSCLFYITDHNSGYRFLVDTAAEVSLIPASTLEREHQQIGFSLQAANNSSIATYSTHCPTLNVRLQRSLPWIFIIGDVQNPILDADFLRHFQLMVDIKGKKLIDTVTCLLVQGVSSREPPLCPVWQVLSPPTPFTSVLFDFPSITRPPPLTSQFSIQSHLRSQ